MTAASEDTRWLATPFGDTMRWITGEHATGEAYSLHERIAPAGAQSSAHTHSHFIESFFVLDGHFAFEIGGESIDGPPGTYVSATRSVSHAWRVVGDAPGRALVVFAPSAKLAFFEELDALVRSASAGPPDNQKLFDLMKRYDWL